MKSLSAILVTEIWVILGTKHLSFVAPWEWTLEIHTYFFSPEITENQLWRKKCEWNFASWKIALKSRFALRLQNVIGYPVHMTAFSTIKGDLELDYQIHILAWIWESTEYLEALLNLNGVCWVHNMFWKICIVHWRLLNMNLETNCSIWKLW